jgi:hypothetical protein
VIPIARKLTAKPLTTWSARSAIEKTAWITASTPPAAVPTSTPSTHESSRSAPKIPKKAPISIMPSRPMLMTPLRSDRMPPIAANTSGVAKRSMAAISADHTKTRSRLPSPDLVATTAAMTASTAATIAP